MLSKDVQPRRPDLTIGGLTLLLASLIGLAALSIIAASPLIAMWAEVYEWLSAAGAWTELRGAWSSQFGGIVLAPFLIVALVPFLELAPAASMVAGSAALLILYFSRAAHFPRMFLASVLIQGAFVAASFYVLDLTSYLTPLLLRELSEQVDFGPPAIEWLQRHDAAAGSASRDLGWLFLGIPAHILRDLGGPLRERDTGLWVEGTSSPRAALLVGGLLFPGLAAALPWLLRRTD
jgi:hypothetical protein